MRSYETKLQSTSAWSAHNLVNKKRCMPTDFRACSIKLAHDQLKMIKIIKPAHTFPLPQRKYSTFNARIQTSQSLYKQSRPAYALMEAN